MAKIGGRGHDLLAIDEADPNSKYGQIWRSDPPEPRAFYTDDEGMDYDIVETVEQVERLLDALDHIMRVTRQANTMTNRLKWIDLRAKSALENTEEWRQYDYPRNRQRAKDNLRRRYRELRELFLEFNSSGQTAFREDAERALEDAGL